MGREQGGTTAPTQISCRAGEHHCTLLLLGHSTKQLQQQSHLHDNYISVPTIIANVS